MDAKQRSILHPDGAVGVGNLAEFGLNAGNVDAVLWGEQDDHGQTHAGMPPMRTREVLFSMLLAIRFSRYIPTVM